MGSYLTGTATRQDLEAFAMQRALKHQKPKRRHRGDLSDVVVPHGDLKDFYGSHPICEGSMTTENHGFTIPSYVSIIYRRLTYDAGVESWAGPELGAAEEAVGVIYTGWVQRLWGHGFFIEIEIDPVNGVNQRIELVHFEEDTCGPLSIPCIKVRGLFMFNWSVNDRSYQVRYAHQKWDTYLQMNDFYTPYGFVMTAGVPCKTWKALDFLNAGYAEGETWVWQTSPEFYWEPCADFLFSLFHFQTQNRMSPWPGEGLPLLAFSEVKNTEKQREQTEEDFEAARGQTTTLDEEAGLTYLGAERSDSLADVNGVTQRVLEEMKRSKELEQQLMLLGKLFPNSHLANFAAFSERQPDRRVMYLYDMEDEERRLEFQRRFPKWATDRILAKPDVSFSHEVATYQDIEWAPPWVNRRYKEVFDFPNRLIPKLSNLDAEAQRQDELVAAVADVKEHENPDPNGQSDWPKWTNPNIANPDTFWTIYFTWR